MLVASTAGAQGMSAEGDSASERALLRAQQLVGDGKSQEGRSLVDSLIAATPPGSARYASALFVRAALAPDAAAAESDYRRVAVEYPLAARAPEALLRLAQLERARGDQVGALRHFERLRTDYRGSAVEAQGHFWTARLLMESNDLPRGCAALAQAHATASGSDVEFRNQIDYEMRRCDGIDTVASPSARIAGAGPTAPPAGRGKARPAPKGNISTSGTAVFTVQVAATKTRAVADRLRQRLAARGFKARIESGAGIHRLRVGRFATHEEAEVVERALRRKGINGFVAEVPSR
ncbi:MAG: hypothetical protein NVS4B2_05940 [Chloroflexota bacterium]